MLAYGKALDEGIYDVKLENGKVAEVTAAESVGGCTVKRVDGETLYLAERGELPWAEAARVYDAAGEVITESQRDAELVYYMKYMDGVIYMIEPDRTGLKKRLTNQYLCIRNEDIDAYYERARMLSVEEQSSVQARNFKKERWHRL